MTRKFIYVFDIEARNKLLSMGYQLIKNDEQENVFVFENKDNQVFSQEDNIDFTFVLSDTLTFSKY